MFQAYGVHINGWSQTSQGIELWVARRSPTKQKWPGKLDHLAAGGQVHLAQKHSQKPLRLAKSCQEHLFLHQH